MATLAAVGISNLVPTPTGNAVAPSLIPATPANESNGGAASPRFVSPVIALDPEAGLALLQVRDGESGDVRFQVPPERVVREYRTVANETEPAGAEAQAGTAPPAETGKTGASQAAYAAPDGSSSSKSSEASK